MLASNAAERKDGAIINDLHSSRKQTFERKRRGEGEFCTIIEFDKRLNRETFDQAITASFLKGEISPDFGDVGWGLAFCPCDHTSLMSFQWRLLRDESRSRRPKKIFFAVG